MNTTIKAKNRILSLVLALCLLLGMTLYLPGPVEVNAAGVDIGKANDLTPDNTGSGTVPGNQVYFGEFDGDPILWRVLENSSGEALLFSEKILTSMPFKEKVNVWAESSIREYLNTELLGKLPTVLQNIIVEADTTISGDEATSDKLYLLSAEEANWPTVDRNINANWWLRSPGDFAYVAAMVDNNGDVQTTHNYNVSGNFGIRPAFQMPAIANIYTAVGDGSQGTPWVVDEQGSAQQTLGENDYVQIAVNGTGKLWKVIAVDDGIATLLCTESLDNQYYNEYGNVWGRSDIRAYLNPEDGVYEANNFSFAQGERKAIVAKNITEKNKQSSDRLFLLSYDEANTSAYFANDNARRSSGKWWLRSPFGGLDANFVQSTGLLGSDDYVSNPLGIRPAFCLDLSSVIFTSDASGASPKSNATVGRTLSSVPKAPTGEIKLTIEDTAINTPDLTFVETTNNTGELRFLYTGAETGGNQYISCVLVDIGGDVAYYGKLAGCATDAAGEFAIDTATITADTYTLKIFCEQANDDQYTDFAGASENMTLEVTGGSGEIRDFTGETLGAPTISTHPTNQSVNAGGTAVFTVEATGSGLTYQWQVSTDGGNNFTDVIDGAGGDTDTYVTPATTMSMDSYQYRVIVTNRAGEITSNAAVLSVNAANAPKLTMSPEKTTLTVGGEVNGETVATADAEYFGGTVAFTIDGTPLPAGLEIDTGDGRIYVDDASALVATPTTTVTVKADDGTDSDTDTVTITIKESGGSDPGPNPGPTSEPSAAIDKDELQVGDITTLRISLGQSGGAPMATGANIAVDDKDVVTVEPDTLNDHENVTVTAIGEGETDIHITFDGVSGYDKTISVKVTGPGDNGNGNNNGNGGGSSSSGSRSSSSSGGSSTPDSRVAKTTLPASAFTWDGRSLTINHDSITPLGLLSVQWDGKALTRGTDFGVYSGSVIVRFSEDFIAAQSPGDHTIKVEFLNHTGETTVMVGDTGLTTETDNLFDNDTHNPNTGGYPDGSYPGATDNPNTGDGRSIWLALLLGSLGGIVLVVRRLKPVA